MAVIRIEQRNSVLVGVGDVDGGANDGQPLRPCEFRAGRYRAAFDAAVAERDAESRYWQARAASELGLQAFKRLDTLPDSRERREVHATLASAERRYPEAIAELKAALKSVAGKDVAITVTVDPSLLGGLIVKMGSRQIDTSLKTKLNSLKLALKEVG